MLLLIHDTRCEAKFISAKFLMLGDDLSVWDFLSSMTFPWLSMIFQSSMTFHYFSRKIYFSRFSRPCGNPDKGHGFSNHRQLGCFSTEFKLTTKKTSRIRIIGHLWGESIGNMDGMFPNHHTCNWQNVLKTPGWNVVILSFFRKSLWR